MCQKAFMQILGVGRDRLIRTNRCFQGKDFRSCGVLAKVNESSVGAKVLVAFFMQKFQFHGTVKEISLVSKGEGNNLLQHKHQCFISCKRPTTVLLSHFHMSCSII